MTRLRELGYAAAFPASGDMYRLHPFEFERLEADWMAGKRFFTGEDLYGGRVTIKLAAVEAVALFSPEVLAELANDEDEGRAEEAIRGLT